MNSSKLYKCILFDLDGVLLDTEKIYMNLMTNYNRKIGIFTNNDFYIKNLLGKTQTEINKYYCKHFKKSFNQTTYWDELLKLRHEFIENNQITIKPGVMELIEYLKTNKYTIGIVTSNSADLTKTLLNNSGIDINLFDVIVSREFVLKTKPSPELYLKAINILNVRKTDVLAVEDSKVGIKSAIKAGISVVYIEDIDVIPVGIRKKCISSCKNIKDVMKILNEKRD
ncbi:MAG: HAD family phosphatase [Bacilli bacterium]|nr:HAD family phosphatase [Bacilli bacterium]